MYVEFLTEDNENMTVIVDDRDTIGFDGNMVLFTDQDGNDWEVPADHMCCIWRW